MSLEAGKPILARPREPTEETSSYIAYRPASTYLPPDVVSRQGWRAHTEREKKRNIMEQKKKRKEELSENIVQQIFVQWFR